MKGELYKMIGYMFKDEEGKYLSMHGGVTDDWFEASKFDEEGIKSRSIYLKCGYKLISFKVEKMTEVNFVVNE